MIPNPQKPPTGRLPLLSESLDPKLDPRFDYEIEVVPNPKKGRVLVWAGLFAFLVIFWLVAAPVAIYVVRAVFEWRAGS